MTCEEFRKAIEVDIVHVTRGERASLVKHAKQCPACRELTMRMTEGPETRPSEVLERHRRMLEQDRRDPEYRQTVGYEE